VLRGRLGELSLEELRGELTIVVEGPADDAPPAAALEQVDAAADRLLAAGLSARDAARSLATEFGLAKRDAYARVIARVTRDA
jgi:16S rRNA C1402 (ribose-2'-O) methylase RsmI